MKFFQSVTSLEDLKKQYRKLAKQHHPDKGGNEKDFIALKDEYDQLAKKLDNNTINNETFKQIIDELINFDIEIEINGTWIWITGNTFEAKGKLKELNFKWAGKKKAWYWHEEGYVRKSKKNFSLEEIREMHEHTKVKTNRKAALGL